MPWNQCDAIRPFDTIAADAVWFLGDRDASRSKRPGNGVIQGVMTLCTARSVLTDEIVLTPSIYVLSASADMGTQTLRSKRRALKPGLTHHPYETHMMKWEGR